MRSILILLLLLFATAASSQVVFNPANGHYYERVDITISWPEAKAAAEARTHLGIRGHLATITSAEENAFIVENLGGELIREHWLGGYQDTSAPDYEEPGGGWRWITGEPFVYTNWGRFEGTPEPNNSGGDEGYLVFFHVDAVGTWNDLNALPQHGYIVEYEPVAQPFELFVVSNLTHSVKHFDGTSATYRGEFVTPHSGDLNAPEIGMAFGPDGNLYVSSTNSHEIKRYNGVTGAYMGNFVPAGYGGLQFPNGLTFGPDGHLYVASNHAVRRYHGVTGVRLPAQGQEEAIFAVCQRAIDLAFGPDGHIYVTKFVGGGVDRFHGSTGAPLPADGLDGATFVSAISELDRFLGLTFGLDGNLYVVNSAPPHAIQRYNGITGQFMDYFIIYPGNSTLSDVAVGPDGNFYVTGKSAHEVKRFNSQGDYMDDVIPSGRGGLLGPSALAFRLANPVPTNLVPRSATLLGRDAVEKRGTALFTLRVTFTDGSQRDFPSHTGATFSAVLGSITSSGYYTAPPNQTRDRINGAFTHNGITVRASKIIKIITP
jgi:hypothetical protein